MNTKSNRCPVLSKIEAFVLQLLKSSSEKKSIEAHIQACHSCRERFINIRTFYNIFNDEYAKPVDYRIFELTKNIEKDSVYIADILLRPQLLDEMPGQRHFKAEIIKSIKQNNASKKTFSLQRDQVLIHAVQSLHTHYVTLFLYSTDKALYSDVIFSIPKTDQTYQSDPKGKIDLGRADIYSFDNLEIMILPNM